MAVDPKDVAGLGAQTEVEDVRVDPLTELRFADVRSLLLQDFAHGGAENFALVGGQIVLDPYEDWLAAILLVEVDRIRLAVRAVRHGDSQHNLVKRSAQPCL